LNTNLFEKKLESMSSSDFNKISAKDEDWKYLGKKIFELNDIEIGSTKEVQQSNNSDIDFNGFSQIVNSDKKQVKITNINDISEPLIDNSIKRPFDKFNIEQFEKVTGGFRIDFQDDVDEYYTINFQSDENSIPYVGVCVEKNKTAKLYFNLNNSVKGNAYPIIELSLKENSNLEIILSVTSLEDVNIANSIYAKVLKDANLKIHTISMGGELSRSRMDIDLIGDGSGFYLDGVYFGEGAQTHDSRVFVNHLGKNTNSNMITKGVLGGKSSSIFTGTIHIAEGAVKTESHQENRNILLSEEAAAQSVPNLEILCDDVICSHGSSVGPIEDEIYHYVMSRGISKIDADKMLIKGFFNQIINDSSWNIIHDNVADIIESKYTNISKGK